MTHLFSKTRSFLQYLCITVLLGCGNSEPSNVPLSYSIKLNENGGMMPYGTTIFLSNQKQCYVAFYIDGIESKIDISPTNEELNVLVKYMYEQKFSKIKTREMEALDRGGSAITARFDDQKISIANMGFSFIQDAWKGSYSNIVDRIFAIARKHITNELHTVEVELDSTLIKAGWQTSFNFNRGVFIGQNYNVQQEDFQTNFKIKTIPGKNKIDCYVVSNNSTNSRKKTMFSHSENIVITKKINQIKFQLVGENIQILYNKKTKIIEHQNLENFSGSTLLQVNIEQTTDDPEYAPFDVVISFKNGTTGELIPLMNTYGSFKDTYADIHYTLIETGIQAAPYLLFFSGQAGDEYNTPGRLILFDKEKKISMLELNEGNRINAEIVEIQPGMIKVKEALMCHQPIISTIHFSQKGLKRDEGVFSQNSVYPNNGQLPELSKRTLYTLKSKLEVTVDGQHKIFDVGDQIQMTLQGVDFNLGVVFIKVNEVQASMTLEKYKAHEFVQSMYGAKCEMG